MGCEMKGIKKITALFLIMILTISTSGFVNKVESAQVSKSQTNDSPISMGVSAHAYVVMDANSGEIIMSQDADKKIYPASTTKLLTAVVAIENCNLDREIEVTQAALNKVDVESSIVGLRAGSTYTMEQLLYMLLIVSAGDAAEVIAEEVAGSSEAFATMMNEKAKQIGMTDSYFDNPVGMDWHSNAKIHSTAHDIAKLTQYAMANYEIRKIVRHSFYTVDNFYNGKSITLGSTNGFLRKRKYADNLFTVIGSKTGTTDKAGFALTTTAKDNEGREVICAFFGNSTRNKMYKDINRLLINIYTNHKDELQKGILNIRYPSVKDIMDQEIEKECSLAK